MIKETFSFNFNELNVRVEEIERILGNEKDENRQMVLDIIADVLEEASAICNIRAEYAIWEGAVFNAESKTMNINGITYGIGKIILGQIKKSESIAVFLCTAGKEIGEISRELIAGKDFLRGYIFDIAGSEIVEAAADRMQGILSQRMETRGLNITNRFSPGYCGWHVSEQHNLFRLVPGNYCGITLNDSALMNPIKSVSGIIGIGREVKMRPYTCSFCDAVNCIYRKKGE